MCVLKIGLESGKSTQRLGWVAFELLTYFALISPVIKPVREGGGGDEVGSMVVRIQLSHVLILISFCTCSVQK